MASSVVSDFPSSQTTTQEEEKSSGGAYKKRGRKSATLSTTSTTPTSTENVNLLSPDRSLEDETPLTSSDQKVPAYRHWRLAPAKFSPGLSSCFLKYDDQVVGSYSSFLTPAYQKILYAVGISLIVVCTLVFAFDAYSRAKSFLYRETKLEQQEDKGKPSEGNLKAITKAATKMFKKIGKSNWTRGIAMAGSAVGAVTVFITQGLQKSFTYKEGDQILITAKPSPSQQGVYDIEQQQTGSKKYSLLPNRTTGNWELYSYRSSDARGVDSNNNTPQSLRSAVTTTTATDEDTSVNAAALRSVKGMTLELSVPSRLKKGMRVRQETNDFTFDVIEFNKLELDVDLPGLGRHNVPFALSGYGQQFKITVPDHRKDDEVYKLYAFVCYIARTCSILPLDILMVLALGTGVPYLAYRGVTGDWWAIRNMFKATSDETKIDEARVKKIRDLNGAQDMDTIKGQLLDIFQENDEDVFIIFQSIQNGENGRPESSDDIADMLNQYFELLRKRKETKSFNMTDGFSVKLLQTYQFFKDLFRDERDSLSDADMKSMRQLDKKIADANKNILEALKTTGESESETMEWVGTMMERHMLLLEISAAEAKVNVENAASIADKDKSNTTKRKDVEDKTKIHENIQKGLQKIYVEILELKKKEMELTKRNLWAKQDRLIHLEENPDEESEDDFLNDLKTFVDEHEEYVAVIRDYYNLATKFKNVKATNEAIEAKKELHEQLNGRLENAKKILKSGKM